MNDSDSSALVARLSAAYTARADLVDPAALAPEPDYGSAEVQPSARAWIRRPHRSGEWRRTAWLAAAAAVIVAATGVVVAQIAGRPGPRADHPPAGTASSSTSETPTSPAPTPPTHSATPAPKPTPTTLGFGKVGTRAEVPWSLVGDGWTVAVLGPANASSSTTDMAQTVYLVDPSGRRYRIASVTGPMLAVADLSGDRERVLLYQAISPNVRTDLAQLNLRTGRFERFTIPVVGNVEYTKPLGKAVVAVRPQPDPIFERFALDGTLQHVYETSRFGKAAPELPLYLPDGATFVTNSATGLVVMGNDGSFIRGLPLPPGTTNCRPSRWWSTGVVLAVCRDSSADRLWRIPVDGRSPTELKVQIDPVVDLGYYAAWPTDAGLFALQETGCGSGGILERVGPDGSVTQVALPQLDSPGVVVTGVTRSDLYLLGNLRCQGMNERVLLKYSAGSGNSTVVLGGPRGGGSVLGALTIGMDQ